MRITIELDNDVLRVVKHLAEEREQSLGRVISDLVRRGLQPGEGLSTCGVIPVLAKKRGARPVSSQMVSELLAED